MIPHLGKSNPTDSKISSAQRPTVPAFDRVALTASADGLNALSQVFAALPPDFPAAMAEHYKQRAIAVVLTGGDGDGSRGVQASKKMGGKVIAQDQATSKVWGIPAAAIATGYVNGSYPWTKLVRR